MKNAAFLMSFLLLSGVFLTIGFAAPKLINKPITQVALSVPPMAEVLGESDPAPVWSATESLRYVSPGYSVSFERPAQTVVAESYRQISITNAPNGPDDDSAFSLFATFNFTPYSSIDTYLGAMTEAPEDVVTEELAVNGRRAVKVTVPNAAETLEPIPMGCTYYLVENRQTLIVLKGHECVAVDAVFTSLQFPEL